MAYTGRDPQQYNLIQNPVCRWMQDHELDLQYLSLVNISLPGSHDSASYTLTRHVMPGSLPWPQVAIVQFVDDIGLPVSRYIIDWSLSQTSDIGMQLRQGIRYLDLRVGALQMP